MKMVSLLRIEPCLAVLGLAVLALPAPAAGQEAIPEARFDRVDRNKDGKITPDELPRPALFERLDRDGDGVIEKSELRGMKGGPRVVENAGEGVAASQLDLAYGDDEKQRLDIYQPAQAQAAPVMIYIHGGGWRAGDKRAVAAKPAYFTERGFVFVSINYRLVPEVAILTQLQDSANAIGWVKEHIAGYGGDPSQLHLIGHSAGAHHVAILATNQRFLEKAGVSLGNLRSVVELDTQALDVPDMMEESENDVYRQAFGSDPARWKELSPRHHVAEGKLIPPFFLVVADDRAPKLAQAEKFKEALEGAGIDCVIHEAPQHTHGSVNRSVGLPDEPVTRAMEEFHNTILGKPGGAGSDEAPGEGGHAFHWQSSLEFDPAAGEGPLPVNAMQLVSHRGSLFCGMATSFERDRYSGGSSYIYSKTGPDDPWQVEANFGPGTSRVGQMFSARFENDANGEPIPGGPREVLVAFTMSIGKRSGTEPLQVRVRDDETGRWNTFDLPTPRVPKANVREIWLHRDRVTGADLLFVAASPSPLGIVTGSYDEDATGGIRWETEPEVMSERRRGTSKWFGMATVNGVLLAADVDTVYRRHDGPRPSWTKVTAFPRGVGDEGGAEVRGLTAVPNLGILTAWPEDEMLFLATRMKLWRLRVPEEPTDKHERVVELDLRPWLSEELGDDVVFAEAAFNRLEPFMPVSGGSPVWPIGFQVVYEVPGKPLSNKDPESFRLKDHALFLLRDRQGNYTLDRIDSEKRLFLARDFCPSPFPETPHSIFACGYNGSYFKGSLGTAWVYEGRVARDGATEPTGTREIELVCRRDYQPGTRDPAGRMLAGTEMMCFAAHGGRLFAGVGNRNLPEEIAPEHRLGAQILVKDSPDAPWRVDHQCPPTNLRINALLSVAFDTDHEANSLDHPVELLVAAPSSIQEEGKEAAWATVLVREGAEGRFVESRVYSAPTRRPSCRSLGLHQDRVTGVRHLFAGVKHGEVYRAAYNPDLPEKLEWVAEPELEGTGRVMGFAVCNGVLYASCGLRKSREGVEGGLYRRIDGPKPRWECVYQWPWPQQRGRSDERLLMRGLSAVPNPEGSGEVLLGTRSAAGSIERIDPENDHRVVELSIEDYFAQVWNLPRYQGASLAAYNGMPSWERPDGRRVNLIGVAVEHPERGEISPDNGSWFLVRREDGSYGHGYLYDEKNPIPTGRSLRGTRTSIPSPFPEDKGHVLYFGGGDIGKRESLHTAWLFRGIVKSVR